MDTFSVVVILVSSLVILLMAGDRIVQLFGKSLGLIYDSMQLLTALLGVILHGIYAGGLYWSIQFGILCLFIPYLIEIIGQRTGFPFGHYRYAPIAGPTLPGKVPIAVVLMWWMLLYASFISTLAIVDLLRWERISIWLLAIVASIIITLWDVAGDPVAVHGGLWNWRHPGGWAGIPLSNFFGWLLTGFISLAVTLFIAGLPSGIHHRPHWLFYLPLLGFSTLHLDYAAAAKRRGLQKAAWVALILGIIHAGLYLLILLYL